MERGKSAVLDDLIKQGINSLLEAKAMAAALLAAFAENRASTTTGTTTTTATTAATATASEQRRSAAALVDKLDAAVVDFERVIGHWEGVKERYYVGERIIRAQEEAWRRVAREIHDGPAQALANIVLRAEICEKLMAAGRPEITQEMEQLKLLVKESLREVRRIIFNLRPMTLDDLGLAPTLTKFLDNLQEQGGPSINFVVSGQERQLPSTIEVALFRIIQEAVQNAKKHAQANRIDVHLDYGPEVITATVKDDGIGFNVDEVQREGYKRQSFGLMNMRERVELLDGEFSINSKEGSGTEIKVMIPALLPAEAAEGEGGGEPSSR